MLASKGFMVKFVAAKPHPAAPSVKEENKQTKKRRRPDLYLSKNNFGGSFAKVRCCLNIKVLEFLLSPKYF